MKQALILPGWHQQLDSNFYPWLKSELIKKGYQVYLPDLPTIHTDKPNLAEQLEFINTLLKLDEETVIFGHSLGCLISMRLAEKQKLDKMFLIAGWDFNDLTAEHKSYWDTPLDHEKIKTNVKEIYVISSDNDPYFTRSTEEDMSKRLAAKYILVPGAGHFTTKYNIEKIPEISAYF